jgi:hypothetical protein
LLGSPFKFIYYFGGGVGYSGIYMLLIYIPFKGCQCHSNRSSIVHAV